MADFQENPFANPKNVNPFEDTAVKEATASKPTLDDYNPFEEEAKDRKVPAPPVEPPKLKGKKQKQKSSGPFKDPVELPQTGASAPYDAPPEYTPTPSSFREEELRLKEQALAEREEALRQQEGNQALIERKNNFPPLPPFCPIKPCFYVNFKVDIPPSERWKMRLITGLLIYYWIVLFYNLICGIAGVILDINYYGITFGVGIAYFILFIPGSLFCWWCSAYTAYRRDSSLCYLWFFFVLAFQILGFVLNMLGIQQLGAAGFVNGANAFNANTNMGTSIGAMYIICGVLWFLAIPVAAVLLFLVHRYYRSSGRSINEATQEAVTGAAKNKYVRQAAVGAAKEGMKAGFAN